MTTLTDNTAAPRWATATRRRAAGDLTVGLVATLVITAATRWLFGLSDTYVVQSLGSYAVLAALVLRSVPNEHTGYGLGPANRVTLGRGTLVLPVSALAFAPAGFTDGLWWWVIAVSTIAMLCDGVDGDVARRTGACTAFGARFDMELDSWLVLALSVLVWRSGKVGPWVLLLGAARYLFVVAGWLWPWLTAELPASLRRKTVCVIEGVVLLVCLGPIISASLAATAAAAALLLLSYSFAVDVRWLADASRAMTRNPSSMVCPPRKMSSPSDSKSG